MFPRTAHKITPEVTNLNRHTAQTKLSAMAVDDSKQLLPSHLLPASSDEGLREFQRQLLSRTAKPWF